MGWDRALPLPQVFVRPSPPRQHGHNALSSLYLALIACCLPACLVGCVSVRPSVRPAPIREKVFLVDNSIHSVVACANYYGLFSLDEIEAESQVRTHMLHTGGEGRPHTHTTWFFVAVHQ